MNENTLFVNCVITHTKNPMCFYLIQPFVMHEPIQQLLSLTLFHFFCGQRVGAVQHVSRRDSSIFRADDQLNLNQKRS